MRLQTIYKPRRKPKSYAQSGQKRKRKKVQHWQVHYQLLYVFQGRKALPGFFLCIFSSLTCLKKHVFSKRDLLRWKVPARLYWDLLTCDPLVLLHPQLQRQHLLTLSLQAFSDPANSQECHKLETS
jgi:hypothetical protein